MKLTRNHWLGITAGLLGAANYLIFTFGFTNEELAAAAGIVSAIIAGLGGYQAAAVEKKS